MNRTTLNDKRSQLSHCGTFPDSKRAGERHSTLAMQLERRTPIRRVGARSRNTNPRSNRLARPNTPHSVTRKLTRQPGLDSGIAPNRSSALQPNSRHIATLERPNARRPKTMQKSPQVRLSPLKSASARLFEGGGGGCSRISRKLSQDCSSL